MHQVVTDRLPVDEAMPERLPQARLTMTVESLGLISKELKLKLQLKLQQRKVRQDSKIQHQFNALSNHESSPFRLPKRPQSLINRETDRYAGSNTLCHK